MTREDLIQYIKANDTHYLILFLAGIRLKISAG